jgi:hypothetical protein
VNGILDFMKKHVVPLFAILSVLPVAMSQADTYTYPQLVSRMTDLRQLAKLPVAGEKTLLVSSYDRRSKYDAATDKYIDWGANADWSNGIRKEGDETVLIDVHGQRGPLEDLPGWSHHSDRRPPVHRLFQRKSCAVQSPQHRLHSLRRSARLRQLHANSFSKIVQDHGGESVGFLLSVHLHSVPGGHGGAYFLNGSFPRRFGGAGSSR